MPPFLLSSLAPLPPPPHLLGKITGTIQKTRLRALQKQALFSVTSLCALGGYTLLTSAQLEADVRTSSFFDFIRLGFSDSDLILQSSQDFVLGLLESLPLEPILVSLFASFFALGTLHLLSSIYHLAKTSTYSLHH